MSIKIMYFGYFSDIVGKKKDIVNAEKARIREIVDKRILKLTGGDFVVLVNGVPSRLDSFVKSGDEVKVLPHMGGG
ncbi:MAG: hypothetical protein DRJ35_00450 [Thermoprotei archaeon]|nr:MAG: hypothetical protein DRJ35_00450 [Thermoprotei archaeon]